MAEYLFTAVASGDVCLVAGTGTFTIERKNGTQYQPLRLSGDIVRIGATNQCVAIEFPGDYRIRFADSGPCVNGSPNKPAFLYTENTGGSGVADGVVTAATLVGNVLTLVRSAGLPDLTVDLSAAVGSGFDPANKDDVDSLVAAIAANPTNVTDLMATMAASPDAITVTDTFGSVIFHGLPI